MATKFLDLEGLKYFKTKQDAANDGKYVPQGITINGVALNKTGITITDDTKLSKTDATSLYLSKTDAAKNLSRYQCQGGNRRRGRYGDQTGHGPDHQRGRFRRVSRYHHPLHG